MEYVGYHVRTASDMNRAGDNAMAIVVWYQVSNVATRRAGTTSPTPPWPTSAPTS